MHQSKSLKKTDHRREAQHFLTIKFGKTSPGNELLGAKKDYSFTFPQKRIVCKCCSLVLRAYLRKQRSHMRPPQSQLVACAQHVFYIINLGNNGPVTNGNIFHLTTMNTLPYTSGTSSFNSLFVCSTLKKFSRHKS